MSDKNQIHRSHNVYILGAGFSRPAGLPVIANFLDCMRESVNWLASNKRERELEAVRRVFDFRLKAAGSAYRMRINPENIEELFSLASALENRATQYETPEESDYVSLAIAATLDYAKWKGQTPAFRIVIKNKDEFEQILRKTDISWRFMDPCTDPSNPGDYFSVPFYDFFAGLASEDWCAQIEDARSTVITFNYDTLLEDSLNRLNIPFTYALPNQFPIEGGTPETIKRLPVLKLHGSMNWAVQIPSFSNEEEMLNYVDDEAANVIAHDSYKDLIESYDTPLLLPPTWRKVFGSTLAGVWNQSVKAIRDATRIIVVGFSLPPTDLHFRYLLAAGLQENISLRDFTVVNFAAGGHQERERQEKLVKKNFNCIFQPLFKKSIRWDFNGVQNFFGNSGFLNSIDRKLDEKRFGQFNPI